MKVATKFKIILAVYGIIPLGVIIYTASTNNIFKLEAFQTSISLAFVTYALLFLFFPFLGLNWLFFRQFKKVENFCHKIRQEKYDEFFKLPNQTSDASDENELTFLMRNLNWMTQQIAAREAGLKEQNLMLNDKNHEIQNLLHNMRQGIMIIGKDGKIRPQYSSHLISILESTNITNNTLEDLLFSDSDISKDQLSQFTCSLDICIGEDEMNYELNEHLFIKKVQKKFPDNKVKILELFWNPIMNDDGIVEKIMLVVKDITEIEKLALKSQKQEKELTILGQIVSMPPEKFLNFTDNSFAFLKENENIIKKSQNSQIDVITSLFRNMHTIKGNARTFGFTFLANVAHEVEQYYNDLRDNHKLWDDKKLLYDLKHIFNAIKEYEDIFKLKLNGHALIPKDSKFVEGKVFNQLEQYIEKIYEKLLKKPDTNTQEIHHLVSKLKYTIDSVNSVPVVDVISTIGDFVPDLAMELGKPAPKLNVNYHALRFTKDAGSMVNNVLMHIIRNSLDHGIEEVHDRKLKNKSEKGELSLNILLQKDQILIEVFDDGQGLDLQKIKEKALDKNIIKANEVLSAQGVAELIFSSGLTTAQYISKISGRGVGMDAVKKMITNADGFIEIILDPAQKDVILHAFKFKIMLPLKHIYSNETNDIEIQKLSA